MFIGYVRTLLSNKIAVGHDELLQVRPDPAADLHHVLPGEHGQHLLDWDNEGVLNVVKGPVGIPLIYAKCKKVQRIDIGRAGLLKRSRFSVVEGFLNWFSSIQTLIVHLSYNAAPIYLPLLSKYDL